MRDRGIRVGVAVACARRLRALLGAPVGRANVTFSLDFAPVARLALACLFSRSLTVDLKLSRGPRI